MIERGSKSKIVKKYNVFKFILFESLSNTTAHGIPNIIKANNRKTKIMWLTFFIASTALCSFLVVQSILDYLSFEVNTKIRTMFDENSNIFPSIKVCNRNMFVTETSLTLLKDLIQQNNLTDIFDSEVMNKMSLYKQKDAIDQLTYFAYAKIFSPNFSDSEKKKLGFPLEDIIIECRYNFEECSHKDFVWDFDKMLGNCYKFNSGKDYLGNPTKLRRSIKGGVYYGLSLTLFTGTLKEFKKINSDLGITLKIDNHTYPVMDNVDTNGIRLGTGFEFNLGIDRVYTIQIPKPYSNCDSEDVIIKSELFEILMKENKIYKWSDCISLCYQKAIANLCNCTDFLSQHGIDVELCNSLDQIKCITDFYLKNYSDKSYISEKCHPICPMECNKTDYKVSMGFSRLVPDMYSDYFKKISKNLSFFRNEPITLDLIRDNLIKFNVYYNSLSYTVISENESINIVSLLSNLGGTLGLFLGISVLSFVELFEIILKVLFN